ncbi:hypothetical protein LLG95_05790 [bacterium]|nr:hypothetical protein [bacterium]
MNHSIHATIRAVRRRLMLVHAIRRALIIIYWLAIALSVLVLAGRFKLPVPTLSQAAPWAGGLGLLWLVVWLIARRVSLFEAAVITDQSLLLKERLSTAMLIGEPRNAAESAVIDDAVAHARAVRPSQVAKLEFQRQLGFAGGSLVMLALLFLFMPTIDPFAKANKEKQFKIEQVKAERERAKQLEELLNISSDLTEIKKPESIANAEKEMKALAKQLEEQRINPEQAEARMEKIGERIKDRREEIQNQLSDASSLNTRGEGRVTNEVSKELAKGNFEEAAKKMEELQNKLAQGKLNEQEKQALAQEMKAMASKMKDNPDLAKSLSAAAEQMAQGNANAAQSNMAEAVKSMTNMQSLFNEMKAIEKMEYDMKGRAQAMAGAAQQGKCPNCGGQLDPNGQCKSCGYKGEGKEGKEGQGKEGQGQGKGGKGKGQGKGDGDGDGGDGNGGQGKGMGKGRAGTGQFATGPTDKQGSGMGGPGQGRGGVARTKEGDVQFQTKKIKGDLTPGEIIARFKVEGKQNPGEITTKYEGSALERAQQSEDSIEHEPMPMEFKSLVRDYFASIKRDQARPGQPAAGAAQPAQPAQPASAPATGSAHPPAP